MEIELSTADKTRIKRNAEYNRYKIITKSIEYYKDFEVGTAVFIKYRANGKHIVGTSTYHSDTKPPTKFIIVENDAGFAFAKRILADGKLGKEIICLTTEYVSHKFEIIIDEDLLDSMLLDQEYDPTAAAKELKKKKSKASRKNDKFRLNFYSAFQAYHSLGNYKIGDYFWTANTTFGNGISKYKVMDIKRFKVDPMMVASNRHWNLDVKMHMEHDKQGFKEIHKLILAKVESEIPYTRSLMELHFYDIWNGNKHNLLVYTHKPYKPEDV